MLNSEALESIIELLNAENPSSGDFQKVFAYLYQVQAETEHDFDARIDFCRNLVDKCISNEGTNEASINSIGNNLAYMYNVLFDKNEKDLYILNLAYSNLCYQLKSDLTPSTDDVQNSGIAKTIVPAFLSCTQGVEIKEKETNEQHIADLLKRTKALKSRICDEIYQYMSSDQRKDHVSNKEINIKSLEVEHLMSASLDSDASSDEECIFQDSSQKSDSFGSISKRILKKQECLEDALKRYNIAVKLETSLTETDSGKTDLEKLETYSELFKNNQEILKSSSNEAVQESLNGIQKILNKIGTVLACVAAAPLSLASYAARGTFKFWKSEKDLAKKAANKTIDGIEEKTSNLGFVSK